MSADNSFTYGPFAYYVINLDQSRNRWRRIDSHLQGFGITAVRVRAIYAADLPSDVIAKVYTEQLNLEQFFLPLKPVEIGCFMSHLKALRAFLSQDKYDLAVILEDDVEFTCDPATFYEQWLKAVSTSVPTMLKLYARRPVDGQCYYQDELNQSVLPRVVPLGTQAAVFNKAAAQQMLTVWQQFGMPVDVAYQHWWYHGVKVLTSVPNHVHEISNQLGGSNISTGTPLSFSYKAYREIKRSWYRLRLCILSRYNYWRSY